MKVCQLYCAAVVSALALLLVMQMVSMAAWPACELGVACEEGASPKSLLQGFARVVVPTLRANPPDFSRLGVRAYEDKGNSSTNCLVPFVDWVNSTTGGFVSSPSMVQAVVRHAGLENQSVVRDALGSLWHTPADFSEMVEQTVSCASTNPMLLAFMCAAVDDPGLVPRVLNASTAHVMTVALHVYLVIERIVHVARDESHVLEILGHHYTSASDGIVAEIVRLSTLEGVSPAVIRFRVQKWYSVSLNNKLVIDARSNPSESSFFSQYRVQLNLLEAAFIDHLNGDKDNVALGASLAAATDRTFPAIDTRNRLTWQFGKDWIDHFVYWNTIIQLGFGNVVSIPILLIPSVICSSPDAAASSTVWGAPDPDVWLLSRTSSLKIYMAFLASWTSEALQGGYVPNLEPDRTQRRQMAAVGVEHSRLPRPPLCCAEGSLHAMYNKILEYAPAFSPTSMLPDELYLNYITLITWIILITAGFGSEIAVGRCFLARLSQQDVGYTWTMVRLFCSLCLVIALFTQSVLGLPFLWLGLWHCGFPEVLTEILSAKRAKDRVMAMMLFASAVAVALHQSAFALIICGIMQGLFPLSRALTAACAIPVLQHVFALMKDHSKVAYIIIEAFLELLFEWEVFVNLDSIKSVHGLTFSRIARGSVLALVVSHWMHIFPAAVDVFFVCKGAKPDCKPAALEGRSSVSIDILNFRPQGQLRNEEQAEDQEGQRASEVKL